MDEPVKLAEASATPQRRLSARIGEHALQQILRELADAIDLAAKAGGATVGLQLHVDAAGHARKGSVDRPLVLG